MPPELVHSLNLRILALDRNRIAALPASLTPFAGLQYLCLRGNRLAELPSHIAELTGLQTLDAAENFVRPQPVCAPLTPACSSRRCRWSSHGCAT